MISLYNFVCSSKSYGILWHLAAVSGAGWRADSSSKVATCCLACRCIPATYRVAGGQIYGNKNDFRLPNLGESPIPRTIIQKSRLGPPGIVKISRSRDSVSVVLSQNLKMSRFAILTENMFFMNSDPREFAAVEPIQAGRQLARPWPRP